MCRPPGGRGLARADAPRVSMFRRAQERTRTGGRKPRRGWQPRQRPPAGARWRPCAAVPPAPFAGRCAAPSRERGEGESRDERGDQHAATSGEREKKGRRGRRRRERDRWGRVSREARPARLVRERERERMGEFFSMSRERGGRYLLYK